MKRKVVKLTITDIGADLTDPDPFIQDGVLYTPFTAAPGIPVEISVGRAPRRRRRRVRSDSD